MMPTPIWPPPEVDVCGGQSLQPEQVLSRVRELLEDERPDLVSENNPRLDPCPCRDC